MGAIFLAVLTVQLGQAATVWTGPTIKFTQTGSTRADSIIPGKVVLTRGSRDVLYNTAAGETSAGGASPADTEWAFGPLSEFATLSYDSLENMRDGNLRALIVNKPMVMHVISQDIYMSVMFTSWGTKGAGGFAYTRSTAPAVAVPPTVSVTSPSAGATFTAPATFDLTADASVTGGSVTNVQYFAGSTSLGSATAAPFKVTAKLPDPGTYALTAVATANGLSSTSGAVNITVTAAAPVSLTGPTFSQGTFSFSYNADVGTSYQVDTSSNLVNWVPLSTNVAASNPARFQDTSASTSFRFYRVGRLANP